MSLALIKLAADIVTTVTTIKDVVKSEPVQKAITITKFASGYALQKAKAKVNDLLQDETSYLMKGKKNADRLLESITKHRTGESTIKVEGASDMTAEELATAIKNASPVKEGMN